MPAHCARRRFLLGLGAFAAIRTAASAEQAAPSPFFDIRRFGALGDGAHPDTRSIQSAIDACAKSGGTVLVPSGTWLSGTLVLKSNVTLQFEAGAILRASRDLQDYPPHVPALRSYTDTYTDKSLIYAEDAENIAICGRGTLDGQGAAFSGPYKVRPYMLRFVACRNVSVEGVTLRDSPMWVQHYLACEHVRIHGITVHSRVNQNNDGIDIDACSGVTISDCDIWCGDDAIVLKATLDRPCRDVVVTNCVLSTLCNALKLGTESNGGFRNIAISNCTVYDTRLAGIAVEMVDGGLLDRVTISNIVMNNVGAPIFIRLGDRARPFIEGGSRPPAGALRNVSISHVQADGAGATGCAIAGLPGHAIENVTLDDIRLVFAGGGKPGAAPVPERPEAYPEYSMFGPLPAYGFYCRHVRNLRLRDVRTTVTQSDERPALACDDVETADLAGCDFAAGSRTASAIRLANARDVLANGCRAAGSGAAWMTVEGARTRNIHLLANDLSAARQAVSLASDVPRGAVVNETR